MPLRLNPCSLLCSSKKLREAFDAYCRGRPAVSWSLPARQFLPGSSDISFCYNQTVDETTPFAKHFEGWLAKHAVSASSVTLRRGGATTAEAGSAQQQQTWQLACRRQRKQQQGDRLQQQRQEHMQQQRQGALSCKLSVPPTYIAPSLPSYQMHPSN